jgi:hypothetical protein
MSTSFGSLLRRPQSPERDGQWSHEVSNAPLQNRILLYDREKKLVETKSQKDGFVGKFLKCIIDRPLTILDGVLDLEQMQRCFVEPDRKEMTFFADSETQTRISKDPNEGGQSHVEIFKINFDRLSTIDRIARSLGGLRYLYMTNLAT